MNLTVFDQFLVVVSQSSVWLSTISVTFYHHNDFYCHFQSTFSKTVSVSIFYYFDCLLQMLISTVSVATSSHFDCLLLVSLGTVSITAYYHSNSPPSKLLSTVILTIYYQCCRAQILQLFTDSMTIYILRVIFYYQCSCKIVSLTFIGLL